MSFCISNSCEKNTMSLFDRMFGQRHQHTSDTPELIQQNIAEGKAIMLDVRSQEEFDAGHLKGVTFIPIVDIKTIEPGTQELPNLDKSKIIYCH